jgi:pimeloyl-ACP methyl ester carboxylesterase
MTTPSTAPPHEHLRVRLPDDRVLTGRVHGPEHGRVVLFVAGAATGSGMTFGESLLDTLGVRLVTMDRPGMGGSTPDPARTAASTARDYAAFAAALGDQAPPPVVANSQGALLGLAMAAAGLAGSLVLVSPADEVAHPSIEAQLPGHARALSRLARSDPAAARELLRAMTPGSMERMVLDSAPAADRRVYDEPGFLARYRAALAEGFGDDGAGYVQDTLLAMRRWEVDLGAITAPVTILFGALDTSHSPDRGRTLAGRVPGAVRRVLPGTGGALLWTHAATVLRAALDPSSTVPDDER